MIKDVIQLGEAREHRGIVVTPLFPLHDPVAAFVTLDEALERGLRITEVDESGSVPELAVENPLDARVLLYDGEELVGAKQNRILNVSVLVDAKTTLKIPVSCVEQGRWSRRSAAFSSARHSASPELRRAKNLALHEAPLMLGRSQGAVWQEVHEKADRLDVHSPTGASADAYRAHAGSLAELEAAFPPEPGQCGAVLAIGEMLCLDRVSRPDAFARLWPKLRRGYMLDALERLDGAPATREQVGAFVTAIVEAETRSQPSAGLGGDLRLDGAGVLGSGLELDGELLQLSGFTSETRPADASPIARPSRRRT
jgi:hypothetical protein